MERHQILLYLGALVGGLLCGIWQPGLTRHWDVAISPALIMLLYATFLGVPFIQIGRAFQDWRFLLAVVAVNFLCVPVVVYLLTRGLVGEPVLLMGALFVLLTPCIDYVIVFTGIAGGAKEKLLASAPLLMLLQVVLLPLYLWLLAGESNVASIDFRPFLTAFVWMIVVPACLATATQWAARRVSWVARVEEGISSSMVILMMLTLVVVVASQVAKLDGQWGWVVQVVPIYVGFAVVMVFIGWGGGRLARLSATSQRAIVFSGITRNSLVILPLVLALPPAYEGASLVVVTQTLVELIVMIICVKVVPRLIPSTGQSKEGTDSGTTRN